MRTLLAGRKSRLAWVLLVVGLLLPLFDLWRWWNWHRRHTPPLYSTRDWSSAYEGGIDLSGYVFRDRNRDGILDLGDVPMAGIGMELTAPDGRRTILRSNLSGFVNFAMSRAKREALIRAPGEYELRVLVPPGWVNTSGNATQRVTVVALPGSPADLVARNPPQPSGLAPNLFIAGRVLGPLTASAPGSQSPLRVTDPGGTVHAVPLEPPGTFRIPAAAGEWLLTLASPESTIRNRRVVVRDAPVQLATFGCCTARSDEESRSPVTIDFESVTARPVAKIPSGFAGLEWNMLNAMEILAGGIEGYVNAVTSGHYIAYNSSGHPVTIQRRDGFDFEGAYFGLGSFDAEGEILRVEAYRQGTRIAEDEFPLSALGPVWFDARYRRIDRLVLATRHSWQFVMDDFEVGGVAAAHERTGFPQPR